MHSTYFDYCKNERSTVETQFTDEELSRLCNLSPDLDRFPFCFVVLLRAFVICICENIIYREVEEGGGIVCLWIRF